MINAKRPPHWSVVLVYLIVLALSSWLIVQLSLPDSLLFVFMVPCVLLAFFYGRWVYLSMILAVGVAAIWVTYLVSMSFVTSLITIVVAALSGLAMAEIVHALVLARARAEKALQRSRERLELALEGAGEGMWDLDTQTGRLYLSPRSCAILGFEPAEVEPNVRWWADRIHPQDAERVRLTVRAHQEGKTPYYETEHRVKMKSGEWKWILDRGKVVERDEQGQPLREVGTHLDITERKQAEEALIRASRLEATATLAGGVAHDFNNLMVGVLGYADLLKIELEGQGDDSRWPDTCMMLDTISASARKANVLAQQMLAFARGGKYRPQVIDLNDSLRQVVSAWGRTLPGTIQLVQEASPDLWPVQADPTQMGQVILNLLTNAVEAIEGDDTRLSCTGERRSGQITIGTSNRALSQADIARERLACFDLKPGDYVCLSVQDTGCGMDEEVQARIFEPFFTTKFQGRGMGLAAAYGIVDHHGGCIAVYSQEGQGATFQVWLPAQRSLAVEDAASTTYSSDRPSPTAVVEPSGRARVSPCTATVLVIEDDAAVRQLIIRVAGRLGCNVLAASNGREAVDIARGYEGEIHLAILDMGMPDMGGPETYPLLVEAHPEIKVILCSGYEMDDAAQALLDAGASAFMAKPFQMSTLEDELLKVLAG
ncbi:MAG: PAS domain-containing protein [Anaerolineae bacterium]|nr:PAS domain-containing protein [Anaerolineae bacterium]